jgi:hypothetical protein
LILPQNDSPSGRMATPSLEWTQPAEFGSSTGPVTYKVSIQKPET